MALTNQMLLQVQYWVNTGVVGGAANGVTNSFEAILFGDGAILLQYLDMDPTHLSWSTESIGFEDATGMYGTQISFGAIRSQKPRTGSPLAPTRCLRRVMVTVASLPWLTPWLTFQTVLAAPPWAAVAVVAKEQMAVHDCVQRPARATPMATAHMQLTAALSATGRLTAMLTITVRRAILSALTLLRPTI